MKKQAIRTFTIVSVLLMLTAVTVSAQSERSRVINISFGFIVGRKTLPAGEYTVEPNRKDSDKVWLVQSRASTCRGQLARRSSRLLVVGSLPLARLHSYQLASWCDQSCARPALRPAGSYTRKTLIGSGNPEAVPT
jgi:hypothetical protein